MQINFFMSPADEQELVDFVYAKRGYFIADAIPGLAEYPILKGVFLPACGTRDDAQTFRVSPSRMLSISNEEYGPLPHDDKLVVRSRNYPFEPIEFIRSYSDGRTFHPGRLWINGLEKESIRFYRALCTFIRKRSETDGNWWFGNESRQFARLNNLELAPSF